ncbi:RelE family toxin-antitoxin system [Klebsiella quasipneumoniae]|nr:RelE family toxin-antitoxin system [Klebsiella quasipneumoniae]
MTNITVLAQSLKRRATSANEFGESLYVKGADVIALVEALEKAQETIAFQQGEIKALLSSLESRTVKLPDLRQIVSGDRYVWSDGVYNYSQDVKVALAAAGIKVEAE